MEGLAWTADGDGVFLSRAGAVFEVPLAGGPAVAVGLEGTPIRADPSGTGIIFQDRRPPSHHDPSELWLLRLGGGRP